MNEAVIARKMEGAAVFEQAPVTLPIRKGVLAIGVPEGRVRHGFPKDTTFVCSPNKALQYLRNNPRVGIVVVFPHNIGGTGLCGEIRKPTFKNENEAKKKNARKPYAGVMIVATDSVRIRREFVNADEICSLGQLPLVLARALNK